MSKEVAKKASKTRNYAFIFYPDCDKHMELFDYIKRSYKYVAMLHDKDVKEDGTGELKKAHYHVLVSYSNPRSLSGVLKEYKDFDVSHAEPIQSSDNYIKYMIHDTADSKDKYQYDKSALLGDAEMIARAFAKDDDDYCVSGLSEILDIIESCPVPTLKYVTRYVIDNRDLLPAFKKYNYLICRLVTEAYELKKKQ